MTMFLFITHAVVFALGALLAESVRPIMARAAAALRPVARNAIREGMLASRSLQRIAAEARNEIEDDERRAIEGVAVFPTERRLGAPAPEKP